MTFFLVLLTGAGIILVTSAIEDVSIADTVRGFVNGDVVKKASGPNAPVPQGPNQVINTSPGTPGQTEKHP